MSGGTKGVIATAVWGLGEVALRVNDLDEVRLSTWTRKQMRIIGLIDQSEVIEKILKIDPEGIPSKKEGVTRIRGRI